MAPAPGQIWTLDDVAQGLVRHGFTNWQVVNMTAICTPESGCDPWNISLNKHDPTSPAYLSVDWGLFQLNDYYIPDEPPLKAMIDPKRSFGQQALDPEWNLKVAYGMLQQGIKYYGWSKSFNLWSAFKNRRHLPYISESLRAARRAGVLV